MILVDIDISALDKNIRTTIIRILCLKHNDRDTFVRKITCIVIENKLILINCYVQENTKIVDKRVITESENCVYGVQN